MTQRVQSTGLPATAAIDRPPLASAFDHVPLVAAADRAIAVASRPEPFDRRLAAFTPTSLDVSHRRRHTVHPSSNVIDVRPSCDGVCSLATTVVRNDGNSAFDVYAKNSA